MTNKNSCHHCSGLGYTEIRDCSGEIQRSETCSFCGGTGYIEEEEEIDRTIKNPVTSALIWDMMVMD